MNLVRRETRVPVLGAAFEPFSLMRGLMRWDPFRDEGLQGDGATFLPSFDIKETKEGYVFTADLPGIRLLFDGRRVTSAEAWAGTPRLVVGG